MSNSRQGDTSMWMGKSPEEKALGKDHGEANGGKPWRNRPSMSEKFGVK